MVVYFIDKNKNIDRGLITMSADKKAEKESVVAVSNYNGDHIIPKKQVFFKEEEADKFLKGEKAWSAY